VVGVGAIDPECATALEEQDAQRQEPPRSGFSAREYFERSDGAPTPARSRRIGVIGFGLVASVMVGTWRTALGVGGWEGSSTVLTDPY
jgi:hypothetical protein